MSTALCLSEIAPHCAGGVGHHHVVTDFLKAKCRHHIISFRRPRNMFIFVKRRFLCFLNASLWATIFRLMWKMRHGITSSFQDSSTFLSCVSITYKSDKICSEYKRNAQPMSQYHVIYFRAQCTNYCLSNGIMV